MCGLYFRIFLFFTRSVVDEAFHPRLALQYRLTWFAQCVGCDSCILFPSAVYWNVGKKNF